MAPGHGDVFKAAMEQNREASEYECESGRETLRDQFEKTYVPEYINVYGGILCILLFILYFVD